MTEGKTLEEQKQSFWKGLLLGCLGTMVVMTTAFSLLPAPQQEAELSATQEASAQAAQKLDEINALIDSSYLFDVDSEQMTDSMIKGYVAGLGDPYSAYYTAEEMEAVMESMNGAYCGIGVMLTQTEDGRLQIIKVFSGSPAQERGVQAGDIIDQVNGMDASDMDMDEMISYIKGEEGSSIQLTVLREGEKSPITMELERRDVSVDTVEYRMLKPGIGYLSLIEFDDVSCDQMTEAIEELKTQGMRSLVLDLRDNPGGLLTSVVDIADLFLPEGQMIFYMEDKAGNREDHFTEDEVIFDGPMAVLINENSASASEVLSGCLKDHERATLIGTTTFGKGIVQTYYDLSDNSGLKLTTDHYFTPNGTDIHGVGIEPHIVVEDGRDEQDDPQLERAIRELAK